QGVLAFAGRELADVVRENRIQKYRRARTADGDFAHVRDVEDAGGFADGEEFVRDAGVLHRHLPAAEFDEFAAEFLVRGKKWRALQHGLRRWNFECRMKKQINPPAVSRPPARAAH